MHSLLELLLSQFESEAVSEHILCIANLRCVNKLHEMY